MAEKIASRDDCALITDFPPGTVPQQFHFLRRNRIIAGMSRGTILIESKIRGGGMMTARLASDYGRTVLALPGRIDDLRSEGCNALIQQKVAEPLTELGLLSEQLSLGRWAGNPASDLEGEVRRCFAGMDYALYSEFEKPEDVAAYRAHPLHQEAKTHFSHLLDTRKSADYEL